MPKLVRKSVDVCSGHGCWPPRIAVSGSPNVKCEGQAVIRVGDSWAVHTCITSHGGTQASDSPNVFVNGQALARVGDSISCGSSNAQGSQTVFVN